MWAGVVGGVALGVLLAALLGACPAEMPSASQPPGTSQPPSAPESPGGDAIGTLVFGTYDKSELPFEVHSDAIYSGVYTAPDGISIDVWLEIRRPAGREEVVERLGVLIQGGTGGLVTDILEYDEGAHSALLSINMRGASIVDITADNECAPGDTFVACLKKHPQFSKTNPRLNARDANAVLSLFADDSPVMLDGAPVKPSGIVPAGTIRSPVNVLTGSFGGVIFAYMLEESRRPALHNVFLEQITGARERPISLGLDAAHRMLDILFRACEDDTACAATYRDMRLNFVDFMHTYAETSVSVDGDMIYASGIFDRVVSIIEEEELVGKAIRYIGAVANAHGGATGGATVITTGAYAPDGYASMLGEQPRGMYGIFPFDRSVPAWSMLLSDFGGFFPGLTNRTAMICSFGINRATDPDSTAHYNAQRDIKLRDLPAYSALSQGGNSDAYTKGTLAYGFLILYRQYLALCPQLAEQSGGLVVPSVSDVPANAVVIYSGGLDIKHDISDARELRGYFRSDRAHLIDHTYLGQARGEDSACLRTIRRGLWGIDTPLAAGTLASALGDDCEESNTLTASGLGGW